jgi:hypothetical protein
MKRSTSKPPTAGQAVQSIGIVQQRAQRYLSRLVHGGPLILLSLMKHGMLV